MTMSVISNDSWNKSEHLHDISMDVVELPDVGVHLPDGDKSNSKESKGSNKGLNPMANGCWQLWPAIWNDHLEK